MRVPARFDRRSLLLWLLAAAIATALVVWDLAARGPGPADDPVDGAVDIEIVD